MTFRSDTAIVTVAAKSAGDMDPAALASRRVVLAATIGNTLEWYDFLVYSFLSVTIAKLFFPARSEQASLLLSIATFGVGIAVRPIARCCSASTPTDTAARRAHTHDLSDGGGHGLDRGRAHYEVIGIWAPLLVVVSRLLQGFSCGGELGGANGDSRGERAPMDAAVFTPVGRSRARPRRFSSAPPVTMVVFTRDDAIATTGRRVAVAIRAGLLIVPVGFYVRSKLEEPQLFLKMRTGSSSLPMRETIRAHYGAALVGIGLSVLFVVSAYILFSVHAHIRRATARHAVLAGAGRGHDRSRVLFVMTPFMALLSDRIGRKPLMLAGALAFALLNLSGI